MPTPQPSPSPVATTVFSKDIIHVLLIGGDTNYVPDMNTDTLIVVVVNTKTRQVSLLSIPRDLWVYIPDYGWGRINTAHRLGSRHKSEGYGPGLLMRTIEQNLGIPIDYWVRVNYDGFVNLVDKLGGIDMIVPCRVNLRYQPPTSAEQEEIILEPGVYHMDGATALRYVRTRRGNSDFDRARRQQQFLRAVWDQFKSADVIPKIPGLWLALKDHFQTSLKLGDVLALAPVALSLQPQRIRSRYLGSGQVEGWTTPEGWSVLVPIPEKVQQVVDSLYAPPSASDSAGDEAARIEVQNGTGRPYLAQIAADQLHWQGLTIVDTGLADRSDYRKSRIIVFNDRPEALALLVRLLEVDPKNVVQQPDPNQPADMRVILGEDYDPCR
jgi:LCP family protein required for cell wall assembly